MSAWKVCRGCGQPFKSNGNHARCVACHVENRQREADRDADYALSLLERRGGWETLSTNCWRRRKMAA